MMLHLSVGWTVFDVIDQRVTGKSWKINSKVRRDRWRPTKNPLMTKLVFLWFWILDKCSNVYLFVDQCFYSTPTKQSSPFTLVNDFGSNHYNCLWYRTIFDTIFCLALNFDWSSNFKLKDFIVLIIRHHFFVDFCKFLYG